MSENTTTAAAEPTPTEAERRLVRPAEGRVVAGVCAGLARYFGISPVVYRVAFAALVLVGGSGVILYAAAWLVIPDQRRGDSIVGEAIRDHRNRPWLVLGVGLVGVGLLLGIAESRLWPDPGDVWLVALAIGLAVVWWQIRDERPEPGKIRAAQSHRGVAAEPLESTLAAGDRGWGPGARRRFPIFFPVVGVVTAAAGVLAVLQATDVVNVDWTLALAGGVVLIGLAVAVGAFFGGVGALAALGAILAAVMLAVSAVDLPLDGPVGDRTERPTSVFELEDRYSQSIGELTVDLRGLELPPGETRIRASVGIGQLTIRVPEAALAEVDAKVAAGEALVFGTRRNGWTVEQRVVDEAGPGAPKLTINAEVGFGDLEVQRG
jgi:phage shock protein PspC (stress-responsive transcriptional regulator)